MSDQRRGGISWTDQTWNPGARPMDIEWARSLRQQCAAATVPFFMKQLDGKRKLMDEFPIDMRVREFPEATT